MRLTGKRKKNREIKFLLPDETQRLFQVIYADTGTHALRNKAIFSVAKYCALRASEVGKIRVDDYDIINNCIYCRRVKGSRSNTIKIVDPIVAEHMNTYYLMRLTTSRSPYLFASQKGSPINRRTLDELIKHYGDLAKLDVTKRHFHILKHTRAMELIDYPGVHLRDVQWWLGHKSINNTMIYLDYTSNAQAQLFKRIAELEKNGGTYANKATTYICDFDTCRS